MIKLKEKNMLLEMLQATTMCFTISPLGKSSEISWETV